VLLELGLLDYPDIVKRPMDFSTIKKALLKGGKYVTFEDVFNDVQLIWDNCKTYNMAGSEIYKLAEYMEKLSKRTIQKFRAQ
jgi:bromodomain-containing factor 1